MKIILITLIIIITLITPRAIRIEAERADNDRAYNECLSDSSIPASECKYILTED